MTYSIHIEGLDRVQKLLGTSFERPLDSACQGIALEVQGQIAPYPPATEANSPSNPKGHWYERGFGPRWYRQDGSIAGRKTSQTLGRRWGVHRQGRLSWLVTNAATYAPYLHAQARQVKWAGARGWRTDLWACRQVIASGKAKRLIVQAIRRALAR